MLLQSNLRRGIPCLQFKGFLFLSAVAFTLNNENRCIVKDAIQSTKQGGIFGEKLRPSIGLHVACENHAIGTFLAVPPVNYIEEKSGVLLVENAPADFVNNQAGWLHEKIHCTANPVELAGIREPLVQFGRFQEISLHLLFTAGAAVRHGQMCFPDAVRTNEREILVGMNRRKRRKILQVLNALAMNPLEIKIGK